jgi:hypothetical protein
VGKGLPGSHFICRQTAKSKNGRKKLETGQFLLFT